MHDWVLRLWLVGTEMTKTQALTQWLDSTQMLFQRMKQAQLRKIIWHNNVINHTAACARYVGESIIKTTVTKTVHNWTVEHAAKIYELISKQVFCWIWWLSLLETLAVSTQGVSQHVSSSILATRLCIQISTYKYVKVVKFVIPVRNTLLQRFDSISILCHALDSRLTRWYIQPHEENVSVCCK